MSDQSEMHKKKKRMNMVLGITLGAMVVLFFTVTIVRLGGNVADWGY